MAKKGHWDGEKISGGGALGGDLSRGGVRQAQPSYRSGKDPAWGASERGHVILRGWHCNQDVFLMNGRGLL
jgi:hypothetical protein